MIKHAYPKALGIVVFSFALHVGGCASSGPSDAALSGDPAALWEEGKKAVERGEKLVREAEEDLVEGRKLVRDGQEKIDRGNAETLQARQAYQSAARASGDSTSPGDLDKEVKRFKKIGNQWEDAINEIRAGNKLVDKGNQRINDAQGQIRKGRGLIESGSIMMRNSQRLRIGEELLPREIEVTDPGRGGHYQ